MNKSEFNLAYRGGCQLQLRACTTDIIIRVMDYYEACFMHLTPGVVHNFPKAVGV